MNVLVVGGGIGGLSAAIALGTRGHRVELVERAARFEGIGAGLIMAPNATQALASLGVDLEPVGQPLDSMLVTRADGTVLNRIDPRRFTGRFGPIYALTRPALHAALSAALPASVTVRLSTSVTSVAHDAQGADVTLSTGETRHFDLVVGADGLHSRVRELTLGPVPYRYSGTTCWRGLTSNFGLTHAVEAWGGECRVGAVPLRDHQLYYFLVCQAPRRAPSPSFEEFKARFTQFRALAPLFAGLSAEPPLHHDLEELDAPVWGTGRVLLLGDAAHAMTPNQGQGAAMAIEDAVALASVLAQSPDGVLERYREVRHQRVRQVQLDSRRLGAVAHWRHPVARWARDIVLRALPAQSGAAQYERVVRPGLRLLEA